MVVGEKRTKVTPNRSEAPLVEAIVASMGQFDYLSTGGFAWWALLGSTRDLWIAQRVPRSRGPSCLTGSYGATARTMNDAICSRVTLASGQ
jgi:hypothetical protein